MTPEQRKNRDSIQAALAKRVAAASKRAPEAHAPAAPRPYDDAWRDTMKTPSGYQLPKL